MTKPEVKGIEIDDSSANLMLIEISKINSRLASLENNADLQAVIIHNKGMDVGMPRRIRDDVKELIGVINRLDNVWDNEEKKRKRESIENDVAKLISKGDITSAFLKTSEELRVYREDMIGVRMFLNMLTFKLNHLENELEKGQ